MTAVAGEGGCYLRCSGKVPLTRGHWGTAMESNRFRMRSRSSCLWKDDQHHQHTNSGSYRDCVGFYLHKVLPSDPKLLQICCS